MQFEPNETTRYYEIVYSEPYYLQKETKTQKVRMMFFYIKDNEKCVVCETERKGHIYIYYNVCDNEKIGRAFEETREYIVADYTVWFRNMDDYNIYYIHSIKKLDTPEEIARQEECLLAMKNAAAATQK
jgi:hypothetical protein